MKLRILAALSAVAAAALVPVVSASAASLPRGMVLSAAPQGTVVTHKMHLERIPVPRPVLRSLPRQSTVSSSNWSGYAALANSGVQLRYISAQFTVPSVNCADSVLGSSGYAYDATWAGLDGSGSSTVEQAGTDAYCDSSGTPTYYSWYEMYPLDPVTFSGVSPGDAISVSVYFNGSGYSINLTDLTTGGSIQTTQACPTGSTCKNHSAEVITEDPGAAEPTVNLADFGAANYTAAAVTSRNGTHGTLNAQSGLWSSAEIVMSDSSSKVMAQPSPLEGGQAFNIRYEAGA